MMSIIVITERVTMLYRWLATTHFEPTDARAAFPCFDEPQLKATFSMKMTREARHISLFNTRKIDTKETIDGEVKWLNVRAGVYSLSLNIW